jgi:hypothetical protein
MKKQISICLIVITLFLFLVNITVTAFGTINVKESVLYFL